MAGSKKSAKMANLKMTGSMKVTKHDLEEQVELVINKVEEDHNIRTYTDLAQFGITIGEETFDAIMEALPEYSILHLAVTSEYNTSIYPLEYGTLIIEDIYDTGATFRFYSKDENGLIRIWKGLYVENTWSGWKEVYNEDTIPTIELITKDDIDEICGGVTEGGLKSSDVDELMSLLTTGVSEDELSGDEVDELMDRLNYGVLKETL